MVASAETTAVWCDAAKQMGAITRQLIEVSTGNSKFNQAMENIRIMRYELIECEEPGAYNNFIRDLKRDLLSGKLGESRKELWFALRKAKLGLISSEEAPLSDVSQAQATEVCDVCTFLGIGY